MIGVIKKIGKVLSSNGKAITPNPPQVGKLNFLSLLRV